MTSTTARARRWRLAPHQGAGEPPDQEPAEPEPGGPVTVPPDPTDPLKREDDGDEEHPGADPVTRPLPPD